MLHSYRHNIYTTVCQEEKATSTSTVTGTLKKAAEKQPGKLEYPRLYELPPCSKSKNHSVPALVCKNLDSRMDERKYRQTYLRLLDYFDRMATKHKWTYFMTFGTLLGSWRHHDVIPWDQDMDLMVEYKDRIDIVDKIDQQERFVPRQCTHHKIRLHDRDHITGTVYVEDVGRWYTPSIDMFFFVRNATHIRRSDYPTWYVSKIDEIFPLHRRPLGPLMLQAPRDVLKMLVTHYKATDVCGMYGNPKCKDFEKYVPFVHRELQKGKMKETLILNNKVLQVKEIDEMKENLPFNAYTLATKRFPGK
ncbi:uncharacterized protein RP688-like isoform X2 [Lineus longissimus]